MRICEIPLLNCLHLVHLLFIIEASSIIYELTRVSCTFSSLFIYSNRILVYRTTHVAWKRRTAKDCTFSHAILSRHAFPTCWNEYTDEVGRNVFHASTKRIVTCGNFNNSTPTDLITGGFTSLYLYISVTRTKKSSSRGFSSFLSRLRRIVPLVFRAHPLPPPPPPKVNGFYLLSFG